MAWHPAWLKTQTVLKRAQKQASPPLRALLQGVIDAMDIATADPSPVELAASTLVLGDLAADLLRQVERLQGQLRAAQATEAQLRKELAEARAALEALARLRSTPSPPPSPRSLDPQEAVRKTITGRASAWSPPRVPPAPPFEPRITTDLTGRRRKEGDE